MNTVVFLGPTLPREEAEQELAATYLPPVRQGDVYRAARTRPAAIGIVDGYFQGVPAVWHKEILFALSQGIYVFGSASMGALRASELASFGMIGVGEVFAAFHRTELEDDDEVAVIHGPPDTGYKPLSEAMVNIRATLNAARKAQMISLESHDVLIRIAKDLPYASRSYRQLIRSANHSIPGRDLKALEDWLPGGEVKQKRADALSMLWVMRKLLESNPPPYSPKFAFQHTAQWEQARVNALAKNLEGIPTEHEAVLDEVRLSGVYPQACRSALSGVLARDAARPLGICFDDMMLANSVERLRRERGLVAEERFVQWRQSQGLNDTACASRVLTNYASVAALLQHHESAVKATIIDELRLTGEFADLCSRSRAKQDVLSRVYLSHPTLADAGITQKALLRWYFQTVRSEETTPEDVEIYVQTHGFGDFKDFQVAVLREYLFRRLNQPDLLESSECGDAPAIL